MAGKIVYLVEVSKPRGSVQAWTTDQVCGADDLAQAEKERLSKVYPDSTYRVRPMPVFTKSRKRL